MPAVQLEANVLRLHPEGQSQDSQVTPLPTSPLALEASSAPVLRADATGSRPRLPKAGTPSHAEVVPIRPALSSGVDDTPATTPARGEPTLAAPPGRSDEPREVQTPPFLASRSLAEDLSPREPGKRTLRWLGVTLGVAGGCASLLLGGMQAPALAAAGGLFILAVLSALPLSYRARALAISGLGATGLGFFSAGSQLRGERLDESLLAGAVFVLGAGLLFRAYHRASRVARLVVMVGILALAAWLVLSGGLGSLTHMDAGWQSWAPALPRVALALLGLISLLVFMDASTTAGGRIWATTLFLVLAAHVFVREAVALYPPTDLGRSALNLPHPELAHAIAIVVVVITGSVALAQLLAASAARRR